MIAQKRLELCWRTKSRKLTWSEAFNTCFKIYNQTIWGFGVLGAFQKTMRKCAAAGKNHDHTCMAVYGMHARPKRLYDEKPLHLSTSVGVAPPGRF